MNDWLEQTEKGTIIRILVQPRASRTQAVGLHGDPPRLKLRVAVPPVDGEANAAVFEFLKKHLRVPYSALTLIRGETARQKDVLCTQLNLEQIRTLLLPCN